MTNKRFLYFLSITAIICSLGAICFQLFVYSKAMPSIEEQYKQMIKENMHFFSPSLPEKFSFCGQEVPLDNVFVRQALDRELTYLTYQHASTFIILKRAFCYFPIIEPILKAQHMPEDLKYLAVAESALNNAVSPAKAEGFWQFMPVTARQYGLIVTDEYDERYNIEKSTLAACKYLKGAYSRLGNNWAIACGLYNCGENGIKQRMIEQNQKSYWNLALNNETARYVYRIMAYKIIMSSPQDYGYYIRKQDCYQPLSYDTIHIDSSINNFYTFSQKIGVDYKYFRLANPELKAKKLTNKDNKLYILHIPTKDSYSWSKLVNKLSDPYEFLNGQYK